MKKILFVLLFYTSVSAQYTNNDYELIKSTFNRSFDKELIRDYLASSNGDSVRAALLSLGHCNDQTWIPEIIKLNFDLYGNYISLALGQLGPSGLSTKFLFNKIINPNQNKYIKECFEALGNTADSSDIVKLLEIINVNKDRNFIGLPYALNNFNSRFPLPQKENFIKFLISKIDETDNLERNFDVLFALYRLGGSEDARQVLINILKSKSNDINALKYYALGSLRKESFFPNDDLLFNELLKDNDPRIRTEAARTLCFYDFKDYEMIEKYLSLLFDVNANVSRQAAISISNIKIEKGLKENLYENILELINNSNITDNARGELFVNYCNYKNDKYLELIENYDSIISPDFIYRILSNYLLLPQNNFDYIKGNIKDTTETDFLNIAQAVIPLQESLSGNAEFNKFILSILNSSSPIGILLIAENLDSVIVENNINALQQIILEQVFTYINNKNYSESLKSLYRLSKNISGNFALELLQIFKTSQVNLLSAFAKNILNEKIYAGADKDIDFNIIWEYSFKYSRAKINTDKGSFVIEFTPSFAPVSVGNFCYLASEKYFNGCLFHRVVPNFVIQTGDPSGTGWSGPGYEIISEYSLQPFDEAYVGMASSGKDTEGSQWFVMHSNFPHLDWRYTNFGKVISGMDIVNKIDQKDRIINIELLK